jgi:hypothetical protein
LAKATATTEHFPHFAQDMKESFWGDVYGKARLGLDRTWEGASRRERDRHALGESCEPAEVGSGERPAQSDEDARADVTSKFLR